MSQFIKEFEEILEEKKIRSGSKIFEIAGLDKSMLSRIRAGARIQFGEIARVAAALDGEPMTFLRLLRARLLEECNDPRAARIRIAIAGEARGVAPDSARRELPPLPPKIETALRNIVAAIPHDAGLRKTILWLGNEVFSSETVEHAALEVLDAAVAAVRPAPSAPPVKAAKGARSTPRRSLLRQHGTSDAKRQS